MGYHETELPQFFQRFRPLYLSVPGMVETIKNSKRDLLEDLRGEFANINVRSFSIVERFDLIGENCT